MYRKSSSAGRFVRSRCSAGGARRRQDLTPALAKPTDTEAPCFVPIVAEAIIRVQLRRLGKERKNFPPVPPQIGQPTLPDVPIDSHKDRRARMQPLEVEPAR
jgi:hypothetical protein